MTTGNQGVVAFRYVVCKLSFAVWIHTMASPSIHTRLSVDLPISIRLAGKLQLLQLHFNPHLTLYTRALQRVYCVPSVSAASTASAASIDSVLLPLRSFCFCCFCFCYFCCWLLIFQGFRVSVQETSGGCAFDVLGIANILTNFVVHTYTYTFCFSFREIH